MKNLKNIAMLIDADNTQLSKLESVIQEISANGRIVVKRAYGNWRKGSLKNWENELKRLAIKAEQQFDYVAGKNATDMALVIDTLDLLLDYMLRETFGEKVYKVTLNGGMSCPNRDGKLGTRGCIFCSEGGSGDFAADAALTITEQIDSQIAVLSAKRPIHKYIAYFQAYTNTYAPVEYLRKIFTEAIHHPSVVALSIGTRPDCLGDEVLDLLSELNRIKPVWIELGLQTIHERTAAYIRRGYPLSVFETAVKNLRERGIEVIVHTILGLPGESENDILATMEYLNHRDIQGIKLQLLHVLKGTDLAQEYLEGKFHVYEREEYLNLLIQCLEHLDPKIVIHRMTGDGPKDLLLAPLWTGRKREVLNLLHHQMKVCDSWQGKQFHSLSE